MRPIALGILALAFPLSAMAQAPAVAQNPGGESRQGIERRLDNIERRLQGNANGAAQPVAAAAQETENRWRYKQHNGQWWYWLPSNRWVYWSNGSWVDYDAATYSPPVVIRRYYVPSYRYSYPSYGYSYPSYGYRYPSYGYGGYGSYYGGLGPSIGLGFSFGSHYGHHHHGHHHHGHHHHGHSGHHHHGGHHHHHGGGHHHGGHHH